MSSPYPPGGQPTPNGQPTPGGQPPFQPHGAPPPGYPQPPQGFPGGQPPYGGPPQGPGQPPFGPGGPPPAPKKRGPLPWIIGGVVALVVLIGIIAGCSALTSRPGGGNEPGGSGTGSGGSSVTASKPDEAVKIYLESIAAGHSADALALLDQQPVSTVLMTDAVLQKSNELAPITNINVTPTAGSGSSSYSYATVQASFAVGGQPKNMAFDVLTKDGKSTLSDGTVSLSLPSANLPVTVNGVDATGEKFDVFPGTYEVKPKNSALTFKNERVTLLDRYSSSTYESLTPQMSEAGLKLFREKLKDAVDACLRSKKLDPGCGLAMPAELRDGSKLKDGTITRTIKGSDRSQIDKAEPKPDHQDPVLVKWRGYVSVDITATTTDGRRGELTGAGAGSTFGEAYMDLSKPDPQIEWNS